jgi:hypothetical protein
MKGRSLKRAILLGCVVALLATPAVAQVRYGSVEGVAKESTGAVLPGVTVTMAGENMMGERVAVTDAEGRFRMVLIPPGLYTVTASMNGFQTVQEDDVRVSLGAVSILEIEMLSGFEETIVVSADSVLIDTTSSKIGTNVTGEFVADIANDRQYSGVMEMLPGVVGGETQMIHGASGSDNMHQVDGADAASIYSGGWTFALNFDNIQEVEVITGGIPAEYGRGTGGMVNLITKSGSNTFHGVAHYIYSDLDLNEELKGDRFYFDEPTKYVEEKRPAFNIGGPILKDKMWFFASWEKRNKYKPITRYETWQDAVADNYTFGKTPYHGKYLTGKVTLQPNTSNIVNAAYYSDRIDIEDRYAYAEYNNRTHDADVVSKQGGDTVIAEWTSILNDNTFLNAKFDWSDKPLNRPPYNNNICYYTSANGGLYFGGPYIEYYSPREQWIYSFTYNQFVDTDSGSHQIKAGVELAKNEVGRYNEYYPGGERIRMYEGLDNTDRYRDRRVYIQRQGMVNTSRDISTVFVQDSWRANSNLTVNLGLRLEDLEERVNTGEAMLDWGWGDRVQPRFGFAYDLKGNNLHGSIGRFHDIIDNTVSRAFSEVPDQIYDLYRWSRTDDDWYFYRRYITGAAYVTKDDLKSPHMDELSLGYKMKLSDTVALGFDGTFREWKDGVEDDDGRNFPDNPAADGNYHYLNQDKVREYKGLEVVLTKNLGPAGIRFLASYTLSKTEGIWGNDDELTGWGDNPFNYYHRWGPTSGDHRHIVKFSGTYFLPAGFLVGVNAAYYSGRPYNRYATVVTSGDGVWDGEDFASYYVYPAGSARMPGWWFADLRIEKEFNLGRGITGSIYADIFNLFDNQEVLELSGFMGEGTLVNDEPGAAFTITEPNDDYLLSNLWQAPRSYYFGVKVEF